jgi:hypothetical protein
MRLRQAFVCVSLLSMVSLVSVTGCDDGTGSGGAGGAGAAGGSGGNTSTGGSGGTTASTTGSTTTTDTGSTGGGGSGGSTMTTTSTTTETGSGGMGGAGGGPTAFLDISFDDPAATYTLTGFGGAEDATIVADPMDAANMVGKVVKSGTAELWAGVTISTEPNNSIPALPFTATATKMTVRVWSPDAGIQVRLKVEDAMDPTKSCETEATTTVASGWETLEFDFTNEAAGTAELNVAYTFTRVSIFFNFGVTGAMAGAKTYYLDNVKF